jgi:S-(hydroxymethyl)glutathione dehydrogenase/alcohol dehydrogenase
MAGGTPVNLNGFGYSELLVCWEEAAIPVWTTLSPAELSLFACVTSTGLGMAMCRFPVVAGTDVVVFGLGPVGMSALQGARIQGAGRIIGVDPIKYRRDLAMKLGATAVVDSNAEGANLVTSLPPAGNPPARITLVPTTCWRQSAVPGSLPLLRRPRI